MNYHSLPSLWALWVIKMEIIFSLYISAEPMDYAFLYQLIFVENLICLTNDGSGNVIPTVCHIH